MGDYPPHGPALGLGGGSSHGGQMYYREESLGAPGWKLGVPSIGGGYEVGRV